MDRVEWVIKYVIMKINMKNISYITCNIPPASETINTSHYYDRYWAHLLMTNISSTSLSESPDIRM